MREPVLVTHHGRPRVVVMGADEYFRLAGERHQPDVPKASDRGLDTSVLLANMTEGFLAFDAELRLTTMNAAAAISSGLRPDDMVGRLVDDPRHGEFGTLLAARLRRVLRTGEGSQFEMRGLVHAHRTYEVKAFPFDGGVALTFGQLTELYDLRKAHDIWTARERALAGVVGLIEFAVSTMGFVERPNQAFCRFLGFASSHIESARLVDFVAPAYRHELGDAMNRVLQGRKDDHVATVEIVSRDHDKARLQLSFARVYLNETCTGLAVAGLAI